MITIKTIHSKQGGYSFPRWLCRVRYYLSSLNCRVIRDGKPTRAHLFPRKLKMDARSWKLLYDEGLNPSDAIEADLDTRVIIPFAAYDMNYWNYKS